MKRILVAAVLLAAAAEFTAVQTPDKQTKPSAAKAAPTGVEQELTQ